MTLHFDHLGSLVVAYGLNIVGAILVAVAGWWAAGKVERLSRGAMTRMAHFDRTVAGFLSSLARYAVLVVVVIVIMQLVGIRATSLIAVLGAASLAIGLALQGTLSNLAAGVMLLLFRPFRAGDTIEVAGKNGTVIEMNLLMTELANSDNVQVLIPNSQVWGAAVTNFSAYPTRRVNASFVVGLEEDVNRVAADVRTFLENDPRVLGEPAPSVNTTNLTDKTVELSVQAWCGTGDVGAVRADLMLQLQRMLHSCAAA
jgi:small conductance mechanosensitive channel